MNTIELECDNLDSCEPGTTHPFPERGETVTACEAVEVRTMSSDEEVPFRPGDEAFVIDHLPEAHQVLAMLGEDKVWICDDDIEGLH